MYIFREVNFQNSYFLEKAYFQQSMSPSCSIFFRKAYSISLPFSGELLFQRNYIFKINISIATTFFATSFSREELFNSYTSSPQLQFLSTATLPIYKPVINRSYNHFHNVLRTFDGFSTFLFTTSKAKRDY